MHPLEPTFFASAAMNVAPRLLNKVLVHGNLTGRIIEVEAYGGTDDPGSHGWRGQTPRTEPMFGPPGHWYVYLSYGVHWCLNAVTNPNNDCGAVLIRAVIPIEGAETMAKRRGRAATDRHLVDGPGKLTQAFGIDERYNATPIAPKGPSSAADALYIADDGMEAPTEPLITPRIGLSPIRGADRLARFVVQPAPR